MNQVPWHKCWLRGPYNRFKIYRSLPRRTREMLAILLEALQFFVYTVVYMVEEVLGV